MPEQQAPDELPGITPDDTESSSEQKRRKTIKEVSDRAKTSLATAAENAEAALAKKREQLAELKDTSLKTVQDIAQRAPDTAVQAIQRSRDMRLAAEEENKRITRFQRFFRKGIIGKGVKTAIEMIPSPVGYGPGDIITALNAIRGIDTISGEKLDPVDRVINGVAAVIPGVPSTPVVELARFIRRHGEETVHAHYAENDEASASQNAKETIRGVRLLRDVIRNAKK